RLSAALARPSDYAGHAEPAAAREACLGRPTPRTMAGFCARLPKIMAQRSAVMDMISNDEPPALVCRIEKSRMGNIVQVGGRIVARQTVAGDFRLTVRSFGPGGSSSVQQSGQFHVAGGREISVGKATVSFGKGAKLAADLEVRVGEQ